MLFHLRAVFFQSEDGIPTGLQVASILANIYLWHFDKFLEQRLGSHLQFCRRYIDDLLALCSVDTDALLTAVNSWHKSIQFEISGQCTVPFLDVTLGISPPRKVHWSIYHKPKNLYLYLLPSCSSLQKPSAGWCY